MLPSDSEHFLRDLQRLLKRLRDNGYTVGTAELRRIQALFQRLDNSRETPTAKQIQDMLAALLCRNPQQQRDFPAHFKAWEKGSATPTDLSKSIDDTDSEQPHPLPPVKSAVWLMLAVALVLAAGLGGLWCYQTDCLQTQPVVIEPEPLPVTDPSVPPAIGTVTAPPVAPNPIPQDEVAPPDEPATEDSSQGTALQQYWQHLQPYVFGGLGVFALWGVLVLFNRRYLQRRLGTRGKELGRLKLKLAISRRLYQSVELSGAIQQLRRHVAVATEHLDIPATLENSIRHWGFFSPVRASAQQRPEYLVLVDKAARNDHQAALIDSLLALMHEEGVSFERWYFEDQPRYCYPDADVFTPAGLDELADKYAGQRLLIFSAAHHFLDAATGKPAQWLAKLAVWPERVIFTLEPHSQWQYLEKPLDSAGLLILPANQQGLSAFLETLHSDRPALTQPDWRNYPPLLVDDPQRWLAREAPAPEVRAELLRQLRIYLDNAAYRWLSACAVYPELHWRLTLYLGEQCHAVNEERLARLSVLPWLRQAYFPDWLRQALLDDLPRRERRRIRRWFYFILSGKALAQEGAVETQIVATQAAPPNASADDQICVEFLAGTLGLPLPGALRPDDLKQRRRAWLVFFGVLALGMGVAWQYENLHTALVDGLQQRWPLPIEEPEIKPLSGMLRVNTLPAAAELRLRHADSSERSGRGGETLRLLAGEWQVSAQALGYLPQERGVTIVAGQALEIDLVLQADPKQQQKPPEPPPPVKTGELTVTVAPVIISEIAEIQAQAIGSGKNRELTQYKPE